MTPYVRNILLFCVSILLSICTNGQAQNSKGWGSPEKPTIEQARAFVEQSKQSQSVAPKGMGNRFNDGLETDRMASASLAERGTSASQRGSTTSFSVTPGGNSADAITPEIQNLSDALNHDPAKIFEYVHNFIEYQDYFGSKKGAHLTLLEGSGNSFDQSALFVALLRAGGHSPEYKYGPAIFTYTELTRWMGLDANPFSHLTNSAFLTEMGLPSNTPISEIPALRKKFAVFFFFDAHGYFYFESITSGNEEFVVLPHLWVSVADNGVTYDGLSPSWKDYTTMAGIDLAAATGYSRSSFLSAAGGTTSSPDAVKSLNYNAITSLLTTYSTNLSSFLKQNHSTRSADRITGTRKINTISIDSLSGAEEIFTWSLSSDWITSATFSAIPDVYFSKLTIQLGYNWNPTTKTWGTLLASNSANPLRMTELQGKKLSLSFSGNVANVRLDEQMVGTAANVTASEVQMRLLATHDHYRLTKQSNGTYLVTKTGKSDQDTVDTYKKGSSFAYALPYTFGNTDKQLRRSQEKLDSYRRSNVADTDWRVVTETLNVMGLSWMYQTYLQSEVIAPLFGIITMDHHRMGRCSQEGGIYIDVGLIFSANRSKISSEDNQNEFNYLSSFFDSAMEHGIIEQLQGEGVSAVSTVRLLHLTNQNGKKLYRVTGSNWNSVNTPTNLSNYSAAVKSEIQTAVVTNGGKGLIPQDANITSGQWTGIGYALQEPTKIAMKIGGNLMGGYSSSTGNAQVDEILKYIRSDPGYVLGTGTGLKTSYNPYTTPDLASYDPVDMASGAFFLEKEELTVGTGSGVRGLGFTRQYNSNRRYDKSQGLGYGWTHDCDIRLAKRTSVNAGLSQTISYQAVPFYVALQVASDLYRNHSNAKEWATSMLAVNWFCDQLKYNAVAVTIGNKTIEFVRMPNGTYEAPANMNLTLTRSGSGASETFSMTERNASTYAFNNVGRVTTITDLWGKVKTFTYTGANLTKVTDGYGRAFNFTWSGGRITAVSDTNSRAVGLQYSGDDLTGCTDVEGKTWGYVYDTQHRMTKTVDPSLRTVVENTYDAENRVSYQLSLGDVNRSYTLRYTGYCNTEEDPQSGIKCFLYDSRSRAIGTIDPLGNQTDMYYDGHDRTTLTITPEFELTDYTYDSKNNITETRDPLNDGTTVIYDPQNRVTTVTDKRGNVTSYNSYNAQHQPLSVTAPLARTSLYSYTTAGDPDTIEDPEGNIVDNDYNALGQITQTKLNSQITGTYTYNAYGDLATSKDALNRITTYNYNKRRQLLSTTLPPIPGDPPAVFSSTYDNESLLATSQDANGNITSKTYTATGKPLSVTFPALPAGNNVLTHTY